MQALQFLKGQNITPPKDKKVEVLDLSSKKESSSTSFKTMLEDASANNESEKASGKNRKTEVSGKADKSVAAENTSKDKKNTQKTCLASDNEEKALLCDEQNIVNCKNFALGTVPAGEEVLFGQVIEQTSALVENQTTEPAFVELAAITEAPLTEVPTAVAQESFVLSEEFAPATQMVQTETDGGSADVVALSSFANSIKDSQDTVQDKKSDSDAKNAELAAFAVSDSLDVATADSDVILKNTEQTVKPGETKQLVNASAKADAPVLTDIAKADVNTVNKITVVDNRGIESKKLTAESVKQTGNELDVTFNFEQQLANQNILSTSDQAASADSSMFQKMLSNQLLNQAPEFVKAGSIILRDNDNGTINLNLKPEALGNVKITLHVTDKGIEGRIVVASKEAFEAFNQNMDNLRQSFKQSGFDSANLSLSLSNGSTEQGGQFNHGQQRSDGTFFAEKTFGDYAKDGGKAPSAAVAAAYGMGDHQVDVVA